MKYKVTINGAEFRSFEERNALAAVDYHLSHMPPVSEKNDVSLYDEQDRMIMTTNPFLSEFINHNTGDEWKERKSMDREISDNPSVYFDIDGTLAKWNVNATMEEIFDTKNHYFAKVEPEPLVINLATMLHEDGVDVCIVSAAELDAIPDKYEWIKKNLPFIEDENIFFAPIGADKTQFIKGNADISVLIDDYNPNLKAWKEAGGHAIKMLNGINSSHSGFGEINFEGLKEASKAFHEWEAETDATDAQVESQKDKLVSRIYNQTGIVAEAIESEIGHNNSPTAEYEKE